MQCLSHTLSECSLRLLSPLQSISEALAFCITFGICFHLPEKRWLAIPIRVIRIKARSSGSAVRITGIADLVLRLSSKPVAKAV